MEANRFIELTFLNKAFVKELSYLWKQGRRKWEEGRKSEKYFKYSVLYPVLKKYIKHRLITEDERNLRVSRVGLCRMWVSPDFSYSKNTWDGKCDIEKWVQVWGEVKAKEGIKASEGESLFDFIHQGFYYNFSYEKPKETVAVIFLYGVNPYILDWEKFPTERLILTRSRIKLVVLIVPKGRESELKLSIYPPIQEAKPPKISNRIFWGISYEPPQTWWNPKEGKFRNRINWNDYEKREGRSGWKDFSLVRDALMARYFWGREAIDVEITYQGRPNNLWRENEPNSPAQRWIGAMEKIHNIRIKVIDEET